MTALVKRLAVQLDSGSELLVADGWSVEPTDAGQALPGNRGECIIAGPNDVDQGSLADCRQPVVAVVSGATDASLIDLADAYLFAGDDPETVGRVLDAAVRPMFPDGVRDLSDGTARAIGALGAEASRIAEALQSLATRASADEPVAVTAASVRRLIKQRRDRDKVLPALLFADPAWDMLLDLTAARLEGHDVPVSSLCIAAAVPTTTALRWIRTLTEAGLFERYNDPNDARRNFIRLTDTAAEAMLTWFRQFIGQWRPV